MSERVETAFIAALRRAAAAAGLEADTGGLQLARRFGLEGLAARHGSGDSEEGALRPAATARRFYEETLLEAARELSAALEHAAVPHAFVRGLALIPRHYHPGDREVADIDLLVPGPLRERTHALLEHIGFVPDPPGEETGPPTLRPVREYRRSATGGSLDRVAVDLHWGLVPVEYLLPRPFQSIPDDLWAEVAKEGLLPSPAAEHHLALIVHHLVAHDILHPKGLLDLALLIESLGGVGGRRFEQMAETIGVLGAARVMHETAVRDLAATPLPNVASPATDRRGRRLRRACALERCLSVAATASEREWQEITPARIRRRMLLADRATWSRMVGDALWPPSAYLRWRWPGLSPADARMRHARRTIRKLTGVPR